MYMDVQVPREAGSRERPSAIILPQHNRVKNYFSTW